MRPYNPATEMNGASQGLAAGIFNDQQESFWAWVVKKQASSVGSMSNESFEKLKWSVSAFSVVASVALILALQSNM